MLSNDTGTRHQDAHELRELVGYCVLCSYGSESYVQKIKVTLGVFIYGGMGWVGVVEQYVYVRKVCSLLGKVCSRLL